MSKQAKGQKVVAVSVKQARCGQAAIYKANEEGFRNVWDHLLTEIQEAMACNPEPKDTADLGVKFSVELQVWDKAKFSELGDFTGC
jgi:hypothetical protein